jgi:hypothetical protein
VLFLPFGSGAAGKTFALAALQGRVPDLAIHDFDEIGVPAGADTAWRHRAIEQWVRRALEYQAEGTDVLLAGQTPFGELLAPRQRRDWMRSWPVLASSALRRRLPAAPDCIP